MIFWCDIYVLHDYAHANVKYPLPKMLVRNIFLPWINKGSNHDDCRMDPQCFSVPDKMFFSSNQFHIMSLTEKISPE